MTNLSKQDEIRLRYRFETHIIRINSTGRRYLDPYIEDQWQLYRNTIEAIHNLENDHEDIGKIDPRKEPDL